MPDASLERTLQPLLARFPNAVIRAVKPERLNELRSRIGSSSALLAFYSECNGFDAGLKDTVLGDVFGIERVVEQRPLAPGLSRLIALRSDGCGNYDCLVVGAGPLEGAVVFWDHEVYTAPSYLLAGSLRTYIEFLVDSLVHIFLPDGTRDPRYEPRKTPTWPFITKGELTHPWPFDEDWMTSRDGDALRHLRDPGARAWLARQKMSAG